MALYAFGYAQLVMIGGIVLMAAGISQLIEHLHEATPPTASMMLAAGIALYLVGDVCFRRAIYIPSSRLRLALVVASLLTIPLGWWAGSGWCLARTWANRMLCLKLSTAARPILRVRELRTRRH